MTDNKALSEKISPVEIKNKEFKKTLRGYSPHEVILYLDQVAKHWEHVQAGEKNLQTTIESLKKEIENWRTKERELDLIRAAALEEADKIRGAATDHGKKLLDTAREQAGEIQGRTQEWLVGIISKLQETDKKRQTLSVELRKNLDQHANLLQISENLGDPLEDKLAEFLNHQRTTEV